jgi:hypothetical protein
LCAAAGAAEATTRAQPLTAAGLGDLPQRFGLAQLEVGDELVQVLVEALAKLVGREVLQNLVGDDQLLDALPLRLLHMTVGGGHERAHGHAGVPVGAALELGLDRRELGLEQPDQLGLGATGGRTGRVTTALALPVRGLALPVAEPDRCPYGAWPCP